MGQGRGGDVGWPGSSPYMHTWLGWAASAATGACLTGLLSEASAGLGAATPFPDAGCTGVAHSCVRACGRGGWRASNWLNAGAGGCAGASFGALRPATAW